MLISCLTAAKILTGTLFAATAITTAQHATNSLMSMAERNSRSMQRFEEAKPYIWRNSSGIKISDEKKAHMLPLLSFLAEMNSQSLEVLVADSDIEGNSELQNARLVMFSEIHTEPEILSHNFQMLSKLARPGDIVLFERPDAGHIDVLTYVFGHMITEQYPHLDSASVRAQAAMAMGTQELAAVLPFAFVLGTGWDLKRLNNKGDDTLVSVFIELMRNIFDMNRALMERNSVLSEIFSKLSCRRIFFIAGAHHLPTAFAFQNEGIRPSLIEMQLMLAKVPHAIVTKKKFGEDKSEAFRLQAQVIQKTISLVLIAIPTTMLGFTFTLLFLPKTALVSIVALTSLGIGMVLSQDRPNLGGLEHLDAYCRN